tara:strand:+ start:1584 stop:2198 length:615 start_codon:yes stop_codon:yes gene_type:complete
MKTGLVIVDAWFLDEWSDLLTKKFGENPVPKWSDEIKNNIKQFSKFLSYVCDVEREKGTTIIHSLGNKSNSFLKFAERNASQVKMEKGDLLLGSDLLGKAIIEEKLDLVFYGGFHFGKCIHAHCEWAQKNLYLNNFKKVDNLNIVLNLSMVLPKHTFKQHIETKSVIGIPVIPEFSDYEPEPYNYYLWSMTGFESIIQTTLVKD